MSVAGSHRAKTGEESAFRGALGLWQDLKGAKDLLLPDLGGGWSGWLSAVETSGSCTGCRDNRVAQQLAASFCV